MNLITRAKIEKWYALIILCISLLISTLFAFTSNSPKNYPSRSEEFLIDTNIVYVGAPFNQSHPAISFDGNNYFVVWQDNRNGNNDIYGARVSQSGVVIDPAGIKICCGADDQSSPAVAFDGNYYLVIWVDNRMGNFDIFGARVTMNGVVIDSNSIAIFTANNSQWRPAVTFGDSNYLVVWEDFRGHDIYGTRVTRDGIVLDPAGIPISAAPVYQSIPAIAFGDTMYFVTWVDERNGIADIYGARVLRNGVVVDTNGIVICSATGAQWNPSINFGAENFLVTWEDNRNTSDYDIYGTRITLSGVVLDPNGIVISSYNNTQCAPTITFDGVNFFVVWEDYRNESWTTSDIYGSRITQSGVVLDPDGIIICDSTRDEYSPCALFDGSRFIISWQQGSGNGTGDIVGLNVDTNGHVPNVPPILITTTVYGQQFPDVQFANNDYLIVWQDERSGSSYTDIYGSRVRPDGTILDPSGIQITTDPLSQMNPAISFDGTNYLAVWQDHSSGWVSPSIMGVRINQQGCVLGSPFLISTWGNNWHGFPEVCFGDILYLCSWWDNRDGYYHDDIYGTRIDTSGFVLDTLNIPICTAQDSQFFSSISFCDTTFLVVWDDWRNGNWDIFACRVTNNGVVLEPNGFVISTALYHQRTPNVISNGVNYFVVWSDYRNSNWDIYAARVTTNGMVLDTGGIAICTAQNTQSYPAAAFDGTNYIVVWQDYRSGFEWDIYGASVSPEGIIIDTFSVSTQPGDQISPAVTHGPGDQILITWSGWTDSINGRPANTMRIWGKFYPFTSVEETALRTTPYAQPLLKVYPNPFRDRLDIRYEIPDTRYEITNEHISDISYPLSATLKIYDATGRLVKPFNHLTIQPFNHILWDGTDNLGRRLPGGVYFIKLEIPDFKKIEKAVLLR